MTPDELAANFWAKVLRGDPAACWEWAGSRDRKGYGRAYGGREVGAVLAHRYAWELTHGPIPEGLLACHHCDNPPCCNPAHLFLGTVKDNSVDMARKGRTHTMRGSANHNSRLTREMAVVILADPRGCCALAKAFGVSNQTVSWVRKHGWGDLPPNHIKRVHGRTLQRLARLREGESAA